GPRVPMQTSPALTPRAAPPPVSPALEGPRLMTVLFRPLPVEPAIRHARSRFAVELVAYHQPDHAISAQYRDLSARLLAPLPSDHARVLLFTSAASGAG